MSKQLPKQDTAMPASPTDTLETSKAETTEHQETAVEALMQKRIPRKRHLPNHDPDMLHGMPSPPGHDAETEQGHPDPFADALDDSRMSDDFMPWHMTGSFGDDEDSRSNFRMDAPAAWNDPLWQPADPPLRNLLAEHQPMKYSPEKAHKKSRKVFLSSPLSSKLRRSPLHGAPHTPLFASCGSFGMGTPIAQLQFDNVFSPLDPETNKPLHKSPPAKRVLLHHRTANLPAPSPMHRTSTQGAIDTSPLKQASIMDCKTKQEDHTNSAGKIRRNGAVSPEKNHQLTQPPSTPTSMKVTLGQSTPHSFANINTKLKANPTLPKTPEKKSSSEAQIAEEIESSFHRYADTSDNLHPFMSQRYYQHEHHRQPAVPPFFYGYEVLPSSTHKHSAPPHTKQRKLPTTGAIITIPAIDSNVTISAKKERDSTSRQRNTSRSSSPMPVSTATVAAKGNDKENEKSGNRDLRSGERVTCNCKKSRCLKLYCDCFSQEQYCEGCKCEDCHNVPSHASLRDQVMREVLSKNPKAFKPRIDIQSHNMGCRCKKSECLKKYCECFEARVLCTSKCKCTGCLNHAGSQQLIDKRRKMKDVVGAQFAMEVSDMKWKSQCPSRPPASRTSGPVLARASTTSQTLHGPPTMIASPSPNLRPPYPIHYMGAMNGSYGYYPMPVPMPYSTPHHGHGTARTHYDYVYQPPHHSPFWVPTNPGTTPVAQWPHHRTITPSAGAPASANKRLIDPTSKNSRPASVRLNQTRNKAVTRLCSFFGSANPEMDPIIVTAIFQFLSAGDMAKVHVVCKQWDDVAKQSA